MPEPIAEPGADIAGADGIAPIEPLLAGAAFIDDPEAAGEAAFPLPLTA